MARWFEYGATQPNNGDVSALVRRIAEVEKRQAAFEQRLTFLEQRPVANADQARSPYGWGDQMGETHYHRDDYNDMAGIAGRVVPWVSTNVRFAESLTSTQFVRATFGQALLLTTTWTGLGALAAWLWELPWYSVGIIGGAGFCVSAVVLVFHNRTLLHKTVTAQEERSRRHRIESHIQVDEIEGGGGRIRSIKFLLIAGVTPEQLREWAVKVQEGSDLAIKAWTGRGALFSEGQYTALMKELERAGYVEPGRGNVARSLTRPGKALLRQLTKI